MTTFKKHIYASVNECINCSSTSSSAIKVPGGYVSICANCKLGTTLKSVNYDYHKNTHLKPKNNQISLYKKFAYRDYNLIKNIIVALPPNSNILEIGSGYGFLGEIIKHERPDVDYLNWEINSDLRIFIKERGQKVVSDINEVCTDSINLIIMNHVLEHIPDCFNYLININLRFNHPPIVLFQTNHLGIIPTYLPYLWYGWQLKQHLYHFTPLSLEIFSSRHDYRFKLINFYCIDQIFDFSLKGFAKIIPKCINFAINGSNHSDAFCGIIYCN